MRFRWLLKQGDFLIECSEVTLDFEQNRALENISLHVKEKERLVLLGANGSGKSTLLRLLAGLYFADKGSYMYGGEQVKKSTPKTIMKRLRSEIGILFQNPDTMLFNPTVFDELAFGLQERDAHEIEAKVQQSAKLCQIEHLLKRSPLKLSGGEKQKVALAAILAPQPKVLLLDEPTANLDPGSTGWLVDLLYELDITLLVSTHNLSMASEFAPRALVLDAAHSLIFDGELQTLWEKDSILRQANLIHKHRNNNHSHAFHLHNWD
jgi:cobalt/nickel transport system ATP-binding protein